MSAQGMLENPLQQSSLFSLGRKRQTFVRGSFNPRNKNRWSHNRPCLVCALVTNGTNSALEMLPKTTRHLHQLVNFFSFFLPSSPLLQCFRWRRPEGCELATDNRDRTVIPSRIGRCTQHDGGPLPDPAIIESAGNRASVP